jgi:NADH-ubiquinone oxidoreductase chain 5
VRKPEGKRPLGKHNRRWGDNIKMYVQEVEWRHGLNFSGSQDIRFMGGLSIYMTFTSSSLMFSNFALCGMPFLAGFYSRDFILEMSSMRYVNMFGFFSLLVLTGLTVCYSFRLFYFVLCGDFNFVPSYSIVETSYNTVFGIIGLLTMSVFGGSSLM